MTTATKNTTKKTDSAICTVEYTLDTIEVTSPTGKTITVETTGALTVAESSLLDYLTDGASPCQRNLSYDSMRLLSALAKKQEAAKSGREIMQTSSQSVVDNVSARTGGSGVDAAEARINQLQKVVQRVTDENYVMLVYDIPTAKNDDCPNPSNKLWFHGFRINLSCWVLPKTRLEHPEVKKLLTLWGEHNLKVHVVEYAETQRDKIRQIAEENLLEEVRRLHTSLINNMCAADEALTKAQNEYDCTTTVENQGSKARERFEWIRDSKIRAILRKSGEALHAAVSCARIFDNEDSLSHLLNGLREAIRSKTLAFNAEMLAKDAKTVEMID